MSDLLHVLFLSVVIVVNVRQCFGDTVHFSRCNYKGFICQNSATNNRSLDITYQCNEQDGFDATIHLWQFHFLPVTASLTIKNCRNLQLNFSCTTEMRSMKLIRIQNISNLQIPSACAIVNTPEMVFENIKYLETIPSNTFSKITNSPTKYQTRDPIRIIFRNTRIGTIEFGAFKILTNIESLQLHNVSIARIQSSALKIRTTYNGFIEILDSVLGVVEPFSIDVVAKNFVISNSELVKMYSNAITADLYRFDFNHNVIKSMHFEGFFISAQNIEIISNYCVQMKSFALQKILSYFPETGSKNSNTPNVFPEFNHSHDNFKLLTHTNVGLIRKFANNLVRCTCENFVWHGTKTTTDLVRFEYLYRSLFMPSNNNSCSFSSCEVPFHVLDMVALENGKCRPFLADNLTKICDVLKGTEKLNTFSTSATIVTVNGILFFFIINLCLWLLF